MSPKFENNVNEKNLILTRAQGAVISRDFQTAARLYKQLLKDDSSNVNYLKELGSIYVKNGEDEKAIPYYNQIITFYPHYIDAMTSLGAIYRRLKRYEESITILEKAVDEGRQTADVYYNLGFTYREMGNYDDAIEAFSLVINENPSDVLAYNHLGAIYLAKKDYEKSIAAFRRGLQIDQNHPILNYNLARCFGEAKMYNDAIRCYENALKTKPGWVDAIKDFSHLLVKCQRSREASELVKHSIELYPNDTKLLGMLGNIYLEQYDYDSAEKTFKRAKKVNNQDVQILAGLAEALERGEKADEALENVLDALDIDPTNNDLKKRYVQTLLSAKQIDAAGSNVKELYNENNQDPQVLDLYGQYYICNNEESKADECFEEINKVNRSYKDYLLSAAGRFDQVGKAERAEQMAKEFVAKNMRNPAGYNMLGKIYTHAGQYQNAIDSYDKSRNLRKPNVLADKQIDSLKDKLNEAALPKDEAVESVAPEEEIVEAVEVDPQSYALAEDEAKNDEFDFGTMGDNVPMAEALQEKEDPFFDDETEPSEEEVTEEETADEEAKKAAEALKLDENVSPFDSLESEPLSEKEQLVGGKGNGGEGGADGAGGFDGEDDDEEFPEINEPIDLSAGFGDPGVKGESEDIENNSEHDPSVSDMLDNVDSDNFDFDQFDETSAYEQEDEPEPNKESEPEFDITQMPDPFSDSGLIAPSMMDSAPGAAMPPQSQSMPESMAAASSPVPSETAAAPAPAPAPVQTPASQTMTTYEDAVIGAADQAMNTVRRANELAQQNLEDQRRLDEHRQEELAQMQEQHAAEMSQMEQQYTDEMNEMRQKMAELEEENAALAEENNAPAVKSLMSTAESLLPTIEKILADDDSALENAAEIELFKKLLELCQFLPDDEKAEFLTSQIRMQMEYIISKMSGVPGLLKTAQSLKKAGILGDEENEFSQLSDFEVTNHELRKVLKYMKKLSEGLSDSYLADAMRSRIDFTLEKIEIAEKSIQIF